MRSMYQSCWTNFTIIGYNSKVIISCVISLLDIRMLPSVASSQVYVIHPLLSVIIHASLTISYHDFYTPNSTIY